MVAGMVHDLVGTLFIVRQRSQIGRPPVEPLAFLSSNNSARLTRSPWRFVDISTTSTLTPVRLPPGRARLATILWSTGSSLTMKTMGIVVVAAWAANGARMNAPGRGNHGDAAANKISS